MRNRQRALAADMKYWELIADNLHDAGWSLWTLMGTGTVLLYALTRY